MGVAGGQNYGHQLAFRRELGQRMYHLGIAAMFVTTSLVWFAIDQPAVGVVQLAAAAVQLLYFFLFAGYGVTLTAEGITLHGFSTQHFAWWQVQSIERTNFMAARRVAVRTSDGRAVRTHAPFHDSFAKDWEFDRKLAAMQQWHLEHMTPGASPQASPVSQSSSVPQSSAAEAPPTELF